MELMAWIYKRWNEGLGAFQVFLTNGMGDGGGNIVFDI